MRPIVIDARTATDHFPGIGRYVVNLARSMSQVAPDLNLTLLHDPQAISTRLTLPDLPRIACPVSPFSVQQQWIVPQHLRRSEASLYHSPYYLMPYWPSVPTALTCYDLIPLIYPEYFTARQRLVYRLTHILALRTARVALSISESTKRDLIRFFHCEPGRIVVTPLAADEHFSPQPPEVVTAIKRKYSLPENYVLYVGTNKPHKNLVRLVQAWQAVNLKSHPPKGTGGRLPNVKLVIAGHWDIRYSGARQVAEELGLEDSVIFVGPVDDADLPALYSGAELFAFPSQYEGFGLPVLEAMACGTPVICSNVSSLPEVSGEAAILIDPLDIEAIAKAIEHVLIDAALGRDLRENGLAQAARFSWKQTAQATWAIYRQMTI